MPTQDIPLELYSLLEKGGVTYWQAKDERKTVTMLSGCTEDLLGQNPDSIISGDSWFTHLHPQDRDLLKKAVFECHGSNFYQVDYRWIRDDGKSVWLRELGRKRGEGSDDLEGLLFSIQNPLELEQTSLTISEREKRKLGRELHDDLCQQLAGMLFFTNNLVFQIKAGKDQALLIEATNEIKKQLQISIEKTRCLSHGLNPVSLARKTFQECLVELIQQTQTLYSINCQFHMASDLAIRNQEIATHLFRITQESINNAVRHGGADTISITLQKEENFGILTIQDNGSGFETDPQNTDGMGLHNLRSRADMIKASIHIGNNKGNGVSVICKFDPNTIEL